MAADSITLRPIGRLRSTLSSVADAPLQGDEGAPDAWLEIDPDVRRAMAGVAAGDELIVLTWFHQARRDVLEVHPRGDVSNPLTGVFGTRSPHRPNPIGLHRVRVREMSDRGWRVGPIEAIDGTPVIDVKIALVTI